VTYRLPWDSDPTKFNWGPTMILSGVRLLVTDLETGRSEVFPLEPRAGGVYETTWGLRITVAEIHFSPYSLVILVEQST
jgi:hypothetical protein